MARTLPSTTQDQIRLAFLETESIRQMALKVCVSRNTVRRLLRQEGLSEPLSIRSERPAHPESSEQKHQEETLWALDFSILQKLFETAQPTGEHLDFVQHIKKLTEAIAKELGVAGSALDQMRLETAGC